MKKIYLLAGLLFATIMMSACTQQVTEEKEPTEEDTTITQDICEIGVEYKHNAVNKVTCTCPKGYGFETVSMWWGPCPREGMSGCPASVLKCVKISE